MKESLRGVRHVLHVFLVRGVPLFDRWSRVAARETLRLRLRKIEFLPEASQRSSPAKAARTQRPAGVSRQRNLDLREANARDVVAIGVGSWNEGGIWRAQENRRRFDRIPWSKDGPKSNRSPVVISPLYVTPGIEGKPASSWGVEDTSVPLLRRGTRLAGGFFPAVTQASSATRRARRPGLGTRGFPGC